MKAFIIFVVLFAASSLFASDYASMRSSALAQCGKIAPSEYQTGLLFNPDGYRSYYVRSECIQKVAIQFRDALLCAQVRRRYSLFSSSWGISMGTPQAANLRRKNCALLESGPEAKPCRYTTGII